MNAFRKFLLTEKDIVQSFKYPNQF